MIAGTVKGRPRRLAVIVYVGHSEYGDWAFSKDFHLSPSSFYTMLNEIASPPFQRSNLYMVVDSSFSGAWTDTAKKEKWQRVSIQCSTTGVVHSASKRSDLSFVKYLSGTITANELLKLLSPDIPSYYDETYTASVTPFCINLASLFSTPFG
jgi:hypothetical protein